MPRSREEQELLELVESVFTERIPFNRLLGLHIGSLAAGQASFRFDMRDELIGNYIRRTLHGGVISAVLDVTGGLVTYMDVLRRMEGASADDKLDRFSRLGTIDVRVDYLRPGVGNHFIATGFVLRTGSRVAVTRSELHNDEGSLIAVGTGTYIVA